MCFAAHALMRTAYVAAGVAAAVARTDCELVEPQHVHHADLGDDRGVHVRPLVCARCHQQAAVAAALNGATSPQRK